MSLMALASGRLLCKPENRSPMQREVLKSPCCSLSQKLHEACSSRAVSLGNICCPWMCSECQEKVRCTPQPEIVLKCRWEASSESHGLGDLYLSVMDALDTIDSSAIYFLEGAGQQSFVTAWGDGFVTNGGIISQHGLSDPRPFFDALLEKPYVDRVRWPGFMHADSSVCDDLAEQRAACTDS